MIMSTALSSDGQGGGSSLSPWMQNYIDGNDFTEVGATDCCPGENDLLKGVVNGALGTLEDSFGLVGLGIKMIGGKEDLIPRLSTKDKTAELTGILLFAAMEPTPGGEISAGGKVLKSLPNSFNILKAYKSGLSPFKGGNNLTNIGRAVTKHPQYFGFESTEALMKAFRSPSAINKLGSDMVKDIVRNGVKSTGAGGRYPQGWVTYTLPNGNAASWSLDGIFIGFRGLK